MLHATSYDNILHTVYERIRHTIYTAIVILPEELQTYVTGLTIVDTRDGIHLEFANKKRKLHYRNSLIANENKPTPLNLIESLTEKFG